MTKQLSAVHRSLSSSHCWFRCSAEAILVAALHTMLHAHQHPPGAVHGVDTNSGSSLPPGAEEGEALSQALLR